MPTFAFDHASTYALVRVVAMPVRRIRSVFRRFAAVNAEARIHKARLEAEMYRNRYRLRTKTDDDLPVIF